MSPNRSLTTSSTFSPGRFASRVGSRGARKWLAATMILLPAPVRPVKRYASRSSFQALNAIQYRPGEAEQHLPIIRQAELSRRSMQQAHPVVLFEVGNLPSDSGLATSRSRATAENEPVSTTRTREAMAPMKSIYSLKNPKLTPTPKRPRGRRAARQKSTISSGVGWPMAAHSTIRVGCK